MTVRLQNRPFNFGAEAQAFATGLPSGAVVTFSGMVRETGGLRAMEIEHYPGMTESAVAAMIEEAYRRFGLDKALVIHRYGRLSVGDTIMMVATAAPHRAEAFQAAEFLMDYLKSRAPFWKKEISAAGANWVEAKAKDETALERW